MSDYIADLIAHRTPENSAEPCTSESPAPDSLGERQVQGSARPASILVVDDEEGVRKLFSRVLVDAGYHVYLAKDGSEAVAMVRNYNIDLVLTDLVMPKQEGIETIQILRKEQPHLRIIAASGAFGGMFLPVAELLGAKATLYKPVFPDQLLAAVRDVLK